MNPIERRLARLEEAARMRAGGDDADYAGLTEGLSAEMPPDLRAGRIDPVSIMPRELMAYLN